MGLLERDVCLAELCQLFDAVGREGGCLALVSGDAGIGKTALLQEFARRQKRARVFWGGCDALLTPRPLAPLHDIARQAKGALLAAVQSGGTREAIFNAALDALEQAAALVIFEDLHWADEATLDLLTFLGRRIHRTRSLLALSYRDDEIGLQHPLRSVLGDLPRARTHRMTLAPLSEAAVGQLAQQAGRASCDLHGITGGNPLFVTEMLAAPADAVPATVRDAVLARAAKLPAAARAVAEFVSIVPGRTEAWLLDRALAPDGAAIAACLGIGMTRDGDGAIAFRHEISRRAHEDSLPPPRLQTLHARALAALDSQAGVAAARLAHHARGAGDTAQVLRHARAAAAQAIAVGSHREAAVHLQAAVDFGGALPPAERAALLDQLSTVAYRTSEHQRAFDARRAALALWRIVDDPVRVGDALRGMSRTSWFAGRHADAETYADAAVAALEGLPPVPELAMAYANRADLCMEVHAIDAAIAWGVRAIDLARHLGADEIVAHAFIALGTARLVAADPAGWPEIEQGLQIALDRGYPEEVARGYTSLAAMAVSGRRYAAAAAHLDAGLRYCEARDLDAWWLYLLAYRARLRFEQSDWNAAGDDAETVLRHPRATAITRIPASRTLGHLRLRRGDPDAASPLSQARALGGPTPELQRVGTLAAIEAEAAWLCGEYGRIPDTVRPVLALLETRSDPRMKGELAVWLYRTGALAAPLDGVAEPYAAEIAGDWRGAAAAWASLGCPYENASVLAAHGPEPEQRRALAIFENLGAQPAAQNLRRKMRSLGIRGLPRGARESTRTDPHGLTRREAQVLSFLAQGLRNAAIAQRLFVSAKTVDNHVSSILAKLGVSSRAEAAALHRAAPPHGA
jgi:DNA-binding CsgD family transcriptional regulator/tetratricopeptide (TPR) repeat protein